MAEARAAALDDWTHQLRVWLRPEGAFDGIFVDQMALALSELEFHYHVMQADILRAIEDASTRWDEDRRAQVLEIARRLSRDPQGVARTLEQTWHGAEYLVDHWRMLRATVAERGGLNEAQRWLAFDLLGVPHHLRAGTKAVPAENDKPALLALANREILRLQTRQEEVLRKLDSMEQELALQGLPLVPDETTRQLRSDIAEQMKRLGWALDMMEQFRSHTPARPSPSTNVP
jgi:hypothetical protein